MRIGLLYGLVGNPNARGRDRRQVRRLHKGQSCPLSRGYDITLTIVDTPDSLKGKKLSVK